MPTLLVQLIKCIHLLLTLSIVGAIFYSFVAVFSPRFETKRRAMVIRLNKGLVGLIFFAGLTGALLIYPRHFSLQTPWIQAAFLLVSVCWVVLLGLLAIRHKTYYRWVCGFVYVLLILILIGVIHDAVTKTTFIFS